MPTTAVTRPARGVPRKRQRSPEYASGLMSCATQAIADSKNPPRNKLRIKFPIEKDHEDVAGTDEITNFSRGNSLLRLSRRRCRITCNQTRSAAEGHELNSPLDKNHHPALKFHDVNKVNEKPDQPRQQTRKMQAKNICDRGSASDHRHVALIEIVERRRRLGFFLDTRSNYFRCVGAALHRHLRHAGKWLTILIVSQRQVTKHKNIREVWDGQLRRYRNASNSIGLRFGAICQRTAKLISGYAARPQHRFRGQPFRSSAAFERHSLGVNTRYLHAL